MVKEVRAWQTADGRVFHKEEEAAEHEARHVLMPLFSAFVDECDRARACDALLANPHIVMNALQPFAFNNGGSFHKRRVIALADAPNELAEKAS